MESLEQVRLLLKENIKFYRAGAGLSQAALAEASNVSTTYIGEIELGRKNPSLITLVAIANTLEVDVYRLFIDPSLNENQKINKFAQEMEKKLMKTISDLKNRY